MSDHDEFGAFLVGFIVGGLTGAVVSLLLAPQSGEETRALIKERSIELRDRAAHDAEEAWHKAEAAAQEARARAEELASVARTRGEEITLKAKESGMELVETAKETAKKVAGRVKKDAGEAPAETAV